MENHPSDLNSLLMRLLEIALDLGRYQKTHGEAAVPPPRADEDDGLDVARAGLVGIARRLLKEADARDLAFPAAVSVDPVWRIFLDLYIHSANQGRVTVSDACVASRAPASTALRWMADLVEQGHLIRTPDAADRRRAYVKLSDATFAKMSSYLAGIAGIASVYEPPRALPNERGA